MSRLLAICTAAILAVIPAVAFAQSGSSAFRNSMGGGMGSGSFGMGSGMGGMGGMGGLGSGGMGNLFGGGLGGGLGSSNLGTAGFGSSSFGRSGFGGAGFGSSGYGSSQYGGGQNFVGRDAGDVVGTYGQGGSAANQFFNNMNKSMKQQSRRSRPTSHQTVQNPPQPMRVEVKVAFTPPAQSSNQLAESIRTRLTKILADHQMSPANFSMEGDTAVLRGAAASDSERAVIGQLVALQPGVSDVRNEMTVGALPNAVVPAAR